MAVNISYMGTKKGLAPSVADVVSQCQPGVMLDAFAGMCAVGEQVAPSRPIWSNDAQLFAAEVGRALFTSIDEPCGAIQAANLYFDVFESHRNRLQDLLASAICAEDALLDSAEYSVFLKRRSGLAKLLARDRGQLQGVVHSLFTRLYSDNFFSLRQAVEADAIVHSIFTSFRLRRISRDSRRWLIIALGRALLKISNSTGHFAQFLKPKSGSFRRHLTQKRRSLWSEWLYSIGELFPAGTISWRKHNKGFHQDSLNLLPVLSKAKLRPAVIYADPPYTDDQYSRYYHLLDTLFLYDYPKVSGAGLYRSGRFQTAFCLKSKACDAFTSLVQSAARTGADLVLSYPSNGLVHEAGLAPFQLLQKYFRKAECCYSIPHVHSTFGASKGAAKANVTELIYMARS
jgi:adenine-specific DNA-methyltransferase